MKENKINKTFLIFLLGALATLGPFSIDMYIPGFSRIAEDFHTQENHVAFTMTSYFIGIALGQLIYGPLIDKYGRKKPLILGLILYLIASLGCVLAYSIEGMVALRFFQALGGSAGMVSSTAIITDVYKPDNRARAFSLIMLVMGIAPIIAPSAGSFFITYFDWEAIFYFLSIYACIVCAVLYFFLPETSKYMHSNKLKLKKITGNYLKVAQNKTFILYTLGGSLANATLFAYIASASYIFLTYYGISKATFSILFAVNASGIISGSYLNGLLSKKIYYIKILNTATVLLAILTLIFASWVYFNPNLPFQWVVVGIFLVLFSIGFTYPNAIAASLAPFTNLAGSASALNGAIRMGVSALITAIIGLLTASSSFTMFAVMAVLSVMVALILRIAKRVAPPKKQKAH